VPAVSGPPKANAWVVVAIKAPMVVSVRFMAFSFRFGVNVSFLCLYIEHRVCQMIILCKYSCTLLL
jgi:hypothetical protein